jgi:hypothetical protein
MSINTVLIDHLSYVTIYHCSLGRSHKTGFTNNMGSLKTSGSRKEQNIVLRGNLKAHYNMELKKHRSSRFQVCPLSHPRFSVVVYYRSRYITEILLKVALNTINQTKPTVRSTFESDIMKLLFGLQINRKNVYMLYDDILLRK